MKTPRSLRRLHLFTILLWLVFICGNVMLFVADLLPGPLAGLLFILVGLTVLICFFALLVRYFRFVGQWRAILLLWLIYSLARIAATFWAGVGINWCATAFLMLAIYALFAALFATAALAIRRDVSVAYLALSLLIAPLVIRAQMLAAGGVLAIFESTTPTSEFIPFAASETLVMALVFLPPLAFLSFVPHFMYLWVKDWRRQPLTANPR